MHRRFDRKMLLRLTKKEDDETLDESPYTSKTLHLGVVQPGTYVCWAGLQESSSQAEEPEWVVQRTPSRVSAPSHSESKDESYETEEEEEEEEQEDEEEAEVEAEDHFEVFNPAAIASMPKAEVWSTDPRRESRRDTFADPKEFLAMMKQDLDMQRQIIRILVAAHKKAQKDWANTPFKLIGADDRGEVDVLKMLFLVVDQPLEEERIVSEYAQEHKSLTPYGEFQYYLSLVESLVTHRLYLWLAQRSFNSLGRQFRSNLWLVPPTFDSVVFYTPTSDTSLGSSAAKSRIKLRFEWAQGQLLHVILPPAIKEWDQQIRSTKGPFLVESGMTLADLAIMSFLDQCQSHVMIDSLMVDNLAVCDLVEAVRSCPKLLAHLQDREEGAHE